MRTAAAAAERHDVIEADTRTLMQMLTAQKLARKKSRESKGRDPGRRTQHTDKRADSLVTLCPDAWTG